MCYMLCVMYYVFSINNFNPQEFLKKSKDWIREDFSLDTTQPEVREKIKEAEKFIKEKFSERKGLGDFLYAQLKENGDLAPVLRQQLKSKGPFADYFRTLVSEKEKPDSVGEEKGKVERKNNEIKFMGEVLFGGDYQNIGVSGNIAVTTGAVGIEVFDVSNPNEVKRLGYCATPGEPYDVEIKGNYAYVADGIAGLTVINIASPDSPYVVTSYQPFGYCWNLQIIDNTVYIADFLGFSIVNITIPWFPILTGKCITLGLTMDVYVVGDYAYIIDLIGYSPGKQDEIPTGVFWVADLTIPFFPELVGWCQMPEYSWGWELVSNGSRADVTDFITVVPVDVSTPSSPSILGRGFSLGLSLGIESLGDYDYTACGVGISKICFWIESFPFPLGFGYIPFWPVNLDIDEGRQYAYGVGSHGFGVIDISGWLSLEKIGEWEAPGYARSSCVKGDYAYVASDWGGLVVIDISDSTKPFIAARCKTEGFFDSAKDIDIDRKRNRAYLANAMGGIAVIDIANPLSPTVISKKKTKWSAHGIDVIDTLAYIADHISGLTIMNVKDPHNMEVVGSDFGWAIANKVHVVDTLAYVGDSWGVHVFNVANPTDPYDIGSNFSFGGADDIFYPEGSDYVYGACWWNGLRTFNVSYLPDSLPDGSECNTPGWAHGVWVLRNYAYIANGAGMSVLYIASPDTAWVIDTYPMKHTAYHTYVKEDLDYVSDYYWYYILFFHNPSLEIEEVEANPKSEFRNPKLIVSPNPFSYKTSIEFRVQSSEFKYKKLTTHNSQLTTLCIYDLSGRLIKSFLINQSTNQLINCITWDGTDDMGTCVPSGVYFVKLNADNPLANGVNTKKLILVR